MGNPEPMLPPTVENFLRASPELFMHQRHASLYKAPPWHRFWLLVVLVKLKLFVQQKEQSMATTVALRRGAPRTLFSKLANPVRAGVPSVSRSFSTKTQVTSTGGDDRGNVEIDRRSSSRDVSRRRDTAPGFFPDVFDPFLPASSLSQVMNLMDQFMDNPFGATSRRGGGASGSRRGVDVKEDGNALYIRMDMPGLSKEDVKITVEQNTLVIRGEEPQESEEEDSGRRYSRRLDLPPNVFKLDDVKAEMKNGVLKLVVPKVAEEEKKDVLEVKVE